MVDPTTFNAFNFAPTASRSPYDNRQAIVNALMQQAGDTSAAQSPWQGLSRSTAGLAAGLLSNPNWSLTNLTGAAPKGGAVPSGTGDLY